MRALVATFMLATQFAPVAAESGWRTGNVMSGEGHTPLSGKVEELAWIAGNWAGEGLGGSIEMSLSPPSAGTMAGAFKLARDGEVVFYEFIVFGEFDGRTAVRLKHFHSDITGWETQDRWVEFPLLHFEPSRAAYFDGLTFRMHEAGGLDAYVIVRDRTGLEQEFSFQYRHRTRDGACNAPRGP